MKTIKVVAAVIRDRDKIFATQRGYGEFKGGWEFPGGKVEAGETIEEALKREFMEELGIAIASADPWCGVEFVYPHAHVRLHFYISHDWKGVPQSREGQKFSWQGSIHVEPLLPATIPLVKWIDDIRYPTASGLASQLNAVSTQC